MVVAERKAVNEVDEYKEARTWSNNKNQRFAQKPKLLARRNTMYFVRLGLTIVTNILLRCLHGEGKNR